MNREQLRPFDRPKTYNWLKPLGDLTCNVVWPVTEYRNDSANLQALRDHLKIGSAVLCFNHFTHREGPLVLAWTISRLGKLVRIIGIPAAQKHYDPQRGSDLIYPMRAAQVVGFELMPIVQHNDTYPYSPEKKRSLYRKFVEGCKRILGSPGGVLLIAPEGTRSQDGRLDKAQPGVEHFARWGENVKFVPLAIVPPKVYNRGLNWFSGIEMRLGEPISLSEVAEGEVKGNGKIADRIMGRIAEMLPENYQGYYRNR